MQNRGFTISVCIAIFAVIIVDNYVTSSIESAKREQGEEEAVVVARRPIHELEELNSTNLDFKPMPHNYRQPGSSLKKEDFTGTLAIAPIMEGEQITRSMVTMPGVRPGLARQVASGKRAVSIRVSDETGVTRLLKPGDRVDVVATIDPTGSGNKTFFETRVVLQDVPILATGKYVMNSLPGILEVDPQKGSQRSKVLLAESRAYTTVTLEVDASQLTTIVFAARNLDLYLALRNNDDIGARDDFGKTMMKDFVTSPLPAKPPPAGPPAKK